jgi:hypothetical protein
MRTSSKSIGFHILLLVFLAYYLSACIGADLAHNHEPDSDFHNDCPACQWDVLYQNDFSGAYKTLNALVDPLRSLGYKQYILSLVLPSENYSISYFSRAPPLPI